MKRFLTILCCAIVVILVFITLGNLDKKFSKRFDKISKEIADRLDAQTSLFNRVIGQNIPVVIPEDYQTKFDALKTSVDNLKENTNDNNLRNSTTLYLDFIRQTPPWIQEQLSQEILTAKYDIDFYSIIDEYNGTQNIEDAIDSLQTFIVSFNNYVDIQKVVDYHNELVEEQNAQYNSAVQNLKAKIAVALGNKNISLREVEDLVEESNAYSDDDSLQDSLATLNNVYTECVTKESLYAEVDSISKSLERGESGSLADVSYDLFASRLAESLYSANSLKYLDSADLVSKINSAVGNLETRRERYEAALQAENKKEELAQIKSEIEACKKMIVNMKTDSTFSATLSILASQLASLNYALQSYGGENTSELYALIDECRKELNLKEESYNSIETQNMKSYNSYALRRIREIHNENAALKGSRQEKANARVSMLKRLDEINTVFLYLPVNTLYQEIYQSIWSNMDSEERITVAENALTTDKKSFDEIF